MDYKRIQNSKKLPQRFYVTMEKYNPDFFETGVWKSKMNRTFFAIRNSVCQCNEIYLPFIPGNENRKFQQKWVPFNQHDAIIKMFIEDEFSQIDCFTFYMNNCEFGMETQGIEQAAKIYFNKLPNMLNEEEIIGLYVISKSPTRYNPKLNYKNYRNAVNTIMKREHKIL